MVEELLITQLLTQQLYEPKNKIVDRIGKEKVICPQSGEIITKTAQDILFLKDFFRFKSPIFFIKKLCHKWGMSPEFEEYTIKEVKSQLEKLGKNPQKVTLEDESCFYFVLSGILKQFRTRSALQCVNMLQSRLKIPKQIILNKIQGDFSIIPNLWTVFDLFELHKIKPPEYLISAEISRLKISLWQESSIISA